MLNVFNPNGVPQKMEMNNEGLPTDRLTGVATGFSVLLAAAFDQPIDAVANCKNWKPGAYYPARSATIAIALVVLALIIVVLSLAVLGHCGKARGQQQSRCDEQMFH